MKLPKCLLAMFCSAFVSALSAQLVRTLGPDDPIRVVRILDPQVSPDGKIVAFIAAKANMIEDRFEPEIYLVDVESKALRKLTHDRYGISSPRWSPIGDRLAYLAQDETKKTQIFILPMGAGDSIQITHSKTSILSFAWSPDGATLAYAATDEVAERKGDARFEDGFEVGNNDLLERSRRAPIHLWLVNVNSDLAASPQSKRLTSGSWSLGSRLQTIPPEFAFTPSGESIVFIKAETPLTGDADSGRLMIANIRTGEIRRLTKATTEEESPIVSPDGSKVGYLSVKDSQRQNGTDLLVTSVEGGEVHDESSELDRSISSAAWLPDGRSILMIGADHTRQTVWLQPLGGKAKSLDLGDLTPSSSINVSKTGALAFTATTPDRPVELFYVNHPGDLPIQLTHLQTVTDGIALGHSETVRWQIDKFDEDGVLTYPPTYVAGRKYPLVLYIHGGPRASSMDTFSVVAQVFAAQGWLVFEPNYRGSEGNGNAFEAAIVRDAGEGPGRDIMAGVVMLERRGLVDEKRIAATGWSYGGYMTAWLIAKYPGVWRAAVTGAPVTDLLDGYSLTDIYWNSIDMLGSSPYVGNNLKLYRDESPITYAPDIKTPTLIMADVGDFRVPIAQSYKLYHALKDNSVPVKFIAYPISGHFPGDPVRARDVWRRWTSWVTHYFSESSAD